MIHLNLRFLFNILYKFDTVLYQFLETGRRRKKNESGHFFKTHLHCFRLHS